MKVYLASSFDLAGRCDYLADALEEVGHEIVSRWWEVDTKEIEVPDAFWYQLPLIKQVYRDHVCEITDEADVVVLVCPRNQVRAFNGANIEVGLALGSGVPVVSYGALDRSAMYVDVTRCSTVEQVLQAVCACR